MLESQGKLQETTKPSFRWRIKIQRIHSKVQNLPELQRHILRQVEQTEGLVIPCSAWQTATYNNVVIKSALTAHRPPQLSWRHKCTVVLVFTVNLMIYQCIYTFTYTEGAIATAQWCGGLHCCLKARSWVRGFPCGINMFSLCDSLWVLQLQDM